MANTVVPGLDAILIAGQSECETIIFISSRFFLRSVVIKIPR